MTRPIQTHIYLENNKLYISPDMGQVLKFLGEIENEIRTIFNYKNQIKSLYDHYRDLLTCAGEMSKIIKEKNIEFKYKFKEPLEKIIDKSKLDIPIRSQMIVLFASIEVLFFLDLAYDNETVNEDQLRKLAMDEKNVKSFLNRYVFTKDNEHYSINVQRLSKTNSKEFRRLRNSLTHFFSINSDSLMIVEEYGTDKVLKMEIFLKQNKLGSFVFLSPEDLQQLVKFAHHLLVRKWIQDYQKDAAQFRRKIEFVKELVKTKGAYMLKENEINL